MSLFRPTAHLLLFSFVFGGTTFYSYVASPIAFKKLEKEQFSVLQHNVFPLFFQIQTVAPALLALTSPIKLQTGAIISLATASVSGAINLFWLLKWNQRVKEKRKLAAEKYSGDELEAIDAPLRKEFGKAHGLSLLFNMTNALTMLSYGIYLSKGIFRYLPK